MSLKKILPAFLVLLLGATLASAAEVSLSSLLDEMLDRNAVTQFPEPAFTCKQASSYDRASKSPTERWFANGDASQFVREETNGDRKEWVLMDEKGPGAIVRWWITAPHYKVNFRVYIDGNEKPEITANIGDLIGGKYLVDAPLSAERARGRNLYLPIPYAKSVKITVDQMPVQGNLYYQINYRTYAEGTAIESFTMKSFQAQMPKIETVQRALLEYPGKKGQKEYAFSLMKNENPVVIQQMYTSPHVINSLTVNVKADDLPQALRSTLIQIHFDKIQTVRVPLGDFFGGGVGVNAYQSWYTKIEEDGTLRCTWKMPFKEVMEMQFTNLDPNQDVAVDVKIDVEPFQWTDRTMYFHADWRQNREIETFREEEKKADWNYIALEGRGVFVGDSLSVLNRSTAWWGEGDEKIYIDGEKFPSHFGTGTEDYYGYAWCTPEFFESPFHAQPRAEGPSNFGNTTNDRFRLLDGIPFTKDFRFDMEIWHWDATLIDYSVVTYWYAFPGVKIVEAPTGKPLDEKTLHEEMKAKVEYKTIYVPKIPGFEFSSMPTGGNLSRQTMENWKDGKWKDDDQLWWTGTKRGDRLELVVQVEKAGVYTLVCEMTKARDYGQFQFYLSGEKLGGIVDLYHQRLVINSGPVVIGKRHLEAGAHVLMIEATGKHPDSAGTMFGLDTYRLESE